jgi:prophage antirepressor-like protein
MGGRQEVRIINEGDVFRLIVNSRLPQAQRFEKWLFEEVIPQIRKTGGYGHSKELEELRKQVMKLEVEITTALVPTVFENQELREENRRLKNRSVCTPDDKREILDLSKAGFNVTQIKEKTKKGKARIKRIIGEAAADAQPGLWDQAGNAASRGHGEAV